ncbi:hypothetical protein B0H15DRAFT_799158 [Mycena belliarum]|uniref:Uncharacterized protein n=1 Tax=Mycena belliarum TaxID=1033014 RepID=A0AAD6UCS0_9AGAR|nr:hypothetical protein B0H15DRAFT_799158 [Mycena belliae]
MAAIQKVASHQGPEARKASEAREEREAQEARKASEAWEVQEVREAREAREVQEHDRCTSGGGEGGSQRAHLDAQETFQPTMIPLVKGGGEACQWEPGKVGRGSPLSPVEEGSIGRMLPKTKSRPPVAGAARRAVRNAGSGGKKRWSGSAGDEHAVDGTSESGIAFRLSRLQRA